MDRMTCVFAMAIVALPILAQPAKQPPATVHVVAKVTGVGSFQLNQETYGLLTVELSKNTKVEVYVPKTTADALLTGDEKRKAALVKQDEAIEAEQKKVLAELAKEKGEDERAKLKARLKELTQAHIHNLEQQIATITGIGTIVISEGAITINNGKLTLKGDARPHHSEQEKDLPMGTVIVVGELQAGDFRVGETKIDYAIANGSSSILLAGVDAKAVADLKGMVRVTGQLRLIDNKAIILDVAKISAVKK